MDTTQHKPWNPAADFPFVLEHEPVETLVGAVLALVEHQQIVAAKVRSSDIGTRMKAVTTSPSQYLMPILAHARHHTAKLEQRGFMSRHDPLIDQIVKLLPKKLPCFVPVMRRWESERAFRIVRRHLIDSYRQHWADLRAEPPDPEPSDDEGIAT